MEGKKQSGSSSSSFVSDLFGSKDPTPSGLFGSIFPPQPKVPLGKKQESFKAESMSKAADPPENYYSRTTEEENPSTGTGTSTGMANKWMSSYSQEQKLQPCPLSSSIYYGGQDLYAYPQKSQDYSYSAYNKDEEDDSGSACRGNWWQGSLYY